MGQVVRVLEVETVGANQQIGGAQGEGRLGDEEEPIGGDGLPVQAHHHLDHAGATGAVPNDKVGVPVEALPGRPGQLEVLVVVGSGLVDPDLVECDSVAGGHHLCRHRGRHQAEHDGQLETGSGLPPHCLPSVIDMSRRG
jgi:hypothetical protein